MTNPNYIPTRLLSFVASNCSAPVSWIAVVGTGVRNDTGYGDFGSRRHGLRTQYQILVDRNQRASLVVGRRRWMGIIKSSMSRPVLPSQSFPLPLRFRCSLHLDRIQAELPNGHPNDGSVSTILPFDPQGHSPPSLFLLGRASSPANSSGPLLWNGTHVWLWEEPARHGTIPWSPRSSFPYFRHHPHPLWFPQLSMWKGDKSESKDCGC